MLNLIRSGLPRIMVLSSVALLLVFNNAVCAQTVKPLAPSNKIPSFADVGRHLEKERQKKAAVLGLAIMSGKALDAPSCKKAMNSCRSYLRNRGGIPGRVTFSVSYSLPYGDDTGVSQSDARTKIYEMAAAECERISDSFKGECSLSNFTLRNQSSGKQKTVTGGASYHLEQ